MGRYVDSPPSLEGLDMYHEAHEALGTAYMMDPRDKMRESIERRALVYAVLAVADAIRESNAKPQEISDAP